MNKNSNLAISSVDKYQQILNSFMQLFQAQINQDKINQQILQNNMQNQIQTQLQPINLQPQYKIQESQPLINNSVKYPIKNLEKSIKKNKFNYLIIIIVFLVLIIIGILAYIFISRKKKNKENQ